ncbi:MAG: NAD(P)H-binding protein [Flavobacteriaceae bacterium]
MNKVKQATLFGATGLIGNCILSKLLNDDQFSKVVVATRNLIDFENKKIEVQFINFDDPEEIKKSISKSSIVFSTIGTTQSKVKGDQTAYRKIDFDITYHVAQACKFYDVEHFLMVSSGGADSKSNNFYLKLKGEIDQAVFDLNLNSALIFRPSLLMGKRKEFRLGERIAQIILPIISFLMPKNFKPIQAEKVANSMINYSKSSHVGNKIIQNADMQRSIDHNNKY